MFEFVVVVDLGAFCFVWLLQCRFWFWVVLGGLPVAVFVGAGFPFCVGLGGFVGIGEDVCLPCCGCCGVGIIQVLGCVWVVLVVVFGLLVVVFVGCRVSFLREIWWFCWRWWAFACRVAASVGLI